MSRRWWVLVAVAVVGVTALVVASRLRTTTTPVVSVTFDGAVGVESGSPGIYTYATSGFEEVDALGGGRHEYPATTAMTITEGPCGPVVRWQPIEERWTEWEHCGPALGVTATTEYHEWFGIADVEEETCTVPRPVSSAIDGIACVAGPTTETYDVEVIGIESVVVGGQTIEALHLRRVSRVSGESVGTSTVDEWRLEGSALIVRYEGESTNVTPSAIGDVTYTERVTLHLVDLLPGG